MKTKCTYLMAALLFLGVSCSNNGSEEGQNISTEQTSIPERGQSSVNDNVSQKDIVKIAVGSPDHTTLVQAVQAADLVDALSNAGPFTVFAPTNAAFEALPKGVVEELLKTENKSKLADILQYHVALSTYDTDRLTDGLVLGEVSSGNVTITHKNGKIMVNDATILASVKASNGIVHVIDKVLLPK